MLFNIACPLSFSCLMRCVIWMLHSCSKYHTPIFQRCVYLQIPLWILMYKCWETGTKLSRAQQSTEVTKWVDVNSSDQERSLTEVSHIQSWKPGTHTDMDMHAWQWNKHTDLGNWWKPRKAPWVVVQESRDAVKPPPGPTHSWHVKSYREKARRGH